MTIVANSQKSKKKINHPGRVPIYGEKMQVVRMNILPDRYERMRRSDSERRTSVSDLLRKAIDNWLTENDPDSTQTTDT